jgi:ankyrin repeat protein
MWWPFYIVKSTLWSVQIARSSICFSCLLQVEAIKALLGKTGVDIEARDKQGQTPLMLAVRAQQQPAALALTAAGASLDVSICGLAAVLP